jgi:hypothetical protein
MRLNVFAALFAILLWGAAPAFAGPPPDVDGDGVADYADNCIDPLKGANPAQDDTDADDCGNVCDADYNQSGGAVDFTDLFSFLDSFALTDALHDNTEPVGTTPIDFTNLFNMLDMFGLVPGPSGTTIGTAVCP